MSHYEEFEDERLSEQELEEVLASYKKQQVIEHLVGPVTSTILHLITIGKPPALPADY